MLDSFLNTLCPSLPSMPEYILNLHADLTAADQFVERESLGTGSSLMVTRILAMSGFGFLLLRWLSYRMPVL